MSKSESLKICVDGVTIHNILSVKFDNNGCRIICFVSDQPEGYAEYLEALQVSTVTQVSVLGMNLPLLYISNVGCNDDVYTLTFSYCE